MHLTEPFLLISVVVLSGGVTCLNPRIDKRPIQRVQFHVISRADTNRAAAPSILICAAIPGLRALVIRQTSSIIPTGRATGFPLIDILGMSANIDHPVNRRRTAKAQSPGAVHDAPIQTGLRLSLESPVEATGIHRQGKRRRHLHNNASVTASRFKEHHIY